MPIIDCNPTHTDAILAILNDAIVNTTALYDYRPRTREMMADWFAAKQRGHYPILGAVDDTGQLMGFATYGPFRGFPAYKYTVEHSLYIAAPHRRNGLGRQLLIQLIARARQQDYHVLIGGIDSSNTASIGLHQSLGFQHVATIPQVGYKFSRWLDLCFYQLVLDTPALPCDG
ncbi:MAG: N-acetyltransferase family protein [Phycisphaeraceae bacterium]